MKGQIVHDLDNPNCSPILDVWITKGSVPAAKAQTWQQTEGKSTGGPDLTLSSTSAGETWRTNTPRKKTYFNCPPGSNLKLFLTDSSMDQDGITRKTKAWGWTVGSSRFLCLQRT